MSNGKLPPEDEALWAKVAATVRPLGAPRGNHPLRRALPPPPPTLVIPARPRPIAGPHAETLDSGWDRRLARGRADPQMVIDLHGLCRLAARDLLYRQLAEARARAFRVVLVITGKGSLPGPEPADLMPGLSGGLLRGGSSDGRRLRGDFPDGRRLRGAIRAELPRWLGEATLSRHIAAVRQAHPRHGGSGAVYLILKCGR